MKSSLTCHPWDPPKQKEQIDNRVEGQRKTKSKAHRMKLCLGLNKSSITFYQKCVFAKSDISVDNFVDRP